jgi:hypothetical protein
MIDQLSSNAPAGLVEGHAEPRHAADCLQRPLRARFRQRLTPSAQHYTQLGNRAQGLYPAATMLFNGH